MFTSATSNPGDECLTCVQWKPAAVAFVCRIVLLQRLWHKGEEEKAVEIWEKTASVFLFVEQVCVPLQLWLKAEGLKLEIMAKKTNQEIDSVRASLALCCFGLLPSEEANFEP